MFIALFLTPHVGHTDRWDTYNSLGHTSHRDMFNFASVHSFFPDGRKILVGWIPSPKLKEMKIMFNLIGAVNILNLVLYFCSCIKVYFLC